MKIITKTTLPAAPSPAVAEFIKCFKENVPFLNQNYKVGSKTLPKIQWRGGGTLNRHDAGLAVDLILFSKTKTEDILAKNLVSFLLDYQDFIKWKSIIYRDVCFDGKTMKPQKYTQDKKHFDHIHIDWLDWSLVKKDSAGTVTSIGWPEEALTTGFEDVLKLSLSDISEQFNSGELPDLNLTSLVRMEF